MKMTSRELPYKKNLQCRICRGTRFTSWINLGDQPLANEYRKEDGKQNKYLLHVVVCSSCGLVQLDTVVSPHVLFTDYKYLSSTSSAFRSHFEELAGKEKARRSDKMFIVDIGSNDGILLRPFMEKGDKVLGIEPSENIAKIANDNGIETICEYFSIPLALDIVAKYGKADLVTITNVFAHVDDILTFLHAVRQLLRKGTGRVMIEVPYLPDMVSKHTFDLIYHEHLSYFTLTTLSLVLQKVDLYICEIEFVPVHGGSIRVYASELSHPIINNRLILKTIRQETEFLNKKEFKTFSSVIEKKKERCMKQLNRIIDLGGTVVGYGAPAKASTMANYYGIGKEHIKCIIDDSVAKQGLKQPGTGIDIVPCTKELLEKTDYLFIFAWNFLDSIKRKMSLMGYKGQYIIPL